MKRDTTGLRWDLREATASAHGALDAKVSTVDISTVCGLTVFLVGNAVAHEALSPFDDAFEGLIGQRLELIQKDLLTLGVQFPRMPLSFTPPTFETAPGYRYVIAGSARGGKLLARRHAASEDTHARAAGQFLNDHRLDLFWKDVQSELAALPRTDATRAAVEEGAIACFELFDTAFDAVMAHNDDAQEARVGG
ncbi:MAG: biliverdin-producing heme oxygenase [Rhodobacteraceae bacterium]|nr:biliverdin-producing heme oxygenase [Paracoccaceae bacterium]